MAPQELFLSSPQGYQIFAREWQPESSPRAVVLLVHGLGEHSGRYPHVADAFNQRGFLIFAPDLPGHGRSAGPRGHIRAYDDFLDLFDWLNQDLRQRYPDIPWFLYGHSMGGNLVLYYTLRRNPSAAGVIACSPGLRPARPSPIPLGLGKVLQQILPSFRINNGLDLSGLSRDPRIIEAYRHDPLVHPYISLRLGVGLISAGEWLLNFKGKFPLPLLLMQGTADRLVDPRATDQFAHHISGDVTYKTWEGFYHELHNEPEKDEVIAYALRWIETLITTSSKS